MPVEDKCDLALLKKRVAKIDTLIKKKIDKRITFRDKRWLRYERLAMLGLIARMEKGN